jgi:hypothetical protein
MGLFRNQTKTAIVYGVIALFAFNSIKNASAGEAVRRFDWAPAVPGYTGDPSNGNQYYPDDQVAQTSCNSIINDLTNWCDNIQDFGNGRRAVPTNDECNTHVTQSQGYTQCLAYMQAGWTILFDTYMIALDAAAFFTCSGACIAMLAASPAAAGWEAACNAAGTADGAADLIDQMVMRAKLNQGLMGDSTGEQVGTAMGVAGVAMGLAGFL